MANVCVDYSQVEQNWATMRRLVEDETDVAAVIKCNAYGLGIGATARTLHKSGCRTFFASTVEEAKQIRKSVDDGDARIIVLHPELKWPSVGADLRNHRLTPCLCSLSDLAVVRNNGLDADHVLYADTGLSQHGVGFAELDSVKALLSDIGDRRVTLLSHLAAADDPCAASNERQLDLFKTFCTELAPDERSLAASAGVLLGSAYHFDLVRVGDALFGINPVASAPAVTRPVLSMTGRIVEIRTATCGASIGYGCRDILPGTTRVAVVRAGYSHGYPRISRDRRYTFVDGRFARVLGQVTMEFTFVDVSHIPQDRLSIGGEVELVGPNIPLNHVADTAGTVATDVLVRLLASADTPEYKENAVERPVPALVV